jgi:signal transduction histidine kinase
MFLSRYFRSAALAKPGTGSTWGLQKRFALLTALGLCLVLSFLGFVSFRALEDSTQRALTQELVLAQFMADLIDRELTIALDTLARIADRLAPSAQSHRPAYLTIVLDTALSELRPFSQRLLLLDTQGCVSLSSPRDPHLLHQCILDPATIQAILHAGHSCACALEYVGTLSEPLVPLTVPIRMSSTGQTTGFLSAGILLRDTNIAGFLPPLHHSQTGHVDLMDQQGMVLASTDPEMLLRKGDHALQFNALIAERQPAVRGCHRCHQGGTTTREDEIMAFAPLSVAPWGVAVRQKRTEVLAPVMQLRRQILLGGAVSLAIVLCVAWVTTRQVVRPLESLSQAAGHIAAGKLDDSLRVRGSGEVGKLAQSFEEMRVKLRTLLEEQRRWNETLEERVQQRTQELTALYEALRSKEEVRSHLLAKLVSAQEEERRRIARELHDDVGQALTAVRMNTAAVELAIPEDRADIKIKLATVRDIAGQALRDLRTLIFDLRPDVLDDLGLVPAVRAHAKEHLESRGMHVTLKVSGLHERLPAEVEVAVFRVLQEAMTNIARHAQATETRIQLQMAEAKLWVHVEDNGTGFDLADASQSRHTGQGWGLRGMEERIGILGGTFSIESMPGHGTCISAVIPLDILPSWE